MAGYVEAALGGLAVIGAVFVVLLLALVIFVHWE